MREIVERIQELKEKRNAVIMAHNYQVGEVQDIADFVGDSLELSRKAVGLDCEVIVFCGVHFMAETAAILSPDKTVIMPDLDAGCPMADMITAEQLRALKKEHPSAVVVTYVNSSAEVKAESDVCCTSANAVKVVEKFADKEVIFTPDKYLGMYVEKQLGKKLILWHGFCPTHAAILHEHIEEQKKKHPEAEVWVHPECTPTTQALADKIFSTGGMAREAREGTAGEVIVGTEVGIIHRLRRVNPAKRFYPASPFAVCPNMKLTSLEKILWALEDMKNVVKIPEDISRRAREAVERMLEVV